MTDPEEEEEEQISLECTYDRDPDEEEEEQISPECTYDKDQYKCEDPNVSPLGMTVMTKPDEQKLTEETGLLKPYDTEEIGNFIRARSARHKMKIL